MLVVGGVWSDVEERRDQWNAPLCLSVREVQCIQTIYLIKKQDKGHYIGCYECILSINTIGSRIPSAVDTPSASIDPNI